MAIEQIERLPDVSFIDDDINLDGIQKQMLQDYQDKYMEETGEETVLDRGEPIALILYACSVQIYQMYMYVDRAGKQNLLKYAFGAFLDNLAALKGIERTAAKPATVTMRFTLSEAQTGAIAIPAGTRVTDGEAYFTTDEYAEIKAGETTVDVACTSIETGVDLNGIHEGAIQTLVDPIPYISSFHSIWELVYMGDGIEKNLVLDRFPYIIGKNSSLVDGILLAQTVSRVHARILQENDTLFLEDHNSTNGTYLNGHLIPMNTRMPLQEGDRLIFATEEFVLKSKMVR